MAKELAEQSVITLSDEDAEKVVAIVFTVVGVGTFFRIEEKWVPATPEESAKYDGSSITDIDYDKAIDLVKKWDNGVLSYSELSDYADPNSDGKETE
jgi:hypothetical protein